MHANDLRYGRLSPGNRCQRRASPLAGGFTLFALDAFFRSAGLNERSRKLNRVVETLLDHWNVRVPTGPYQASGGCSIREDMRRPILNDPVASYRSFRRSGVRSESTVTKGFRSGVVSPEPQRQLPHPVDPRFVIRNQHVRSK